MKKYLANRERLVVYAVPYQENSFFHSPWFQKIIKDNKLRDLLLEYCSEDEVLGCIGEMFSPERVKNFILDVSTEDVATLLKNSLA